MTKNEIAEVLKAMARRAFEDAEAEEKIANANDNTDIKAGFRAMADANANRASAYTLVIGMLENDTLAELMKKTYIG